VRNVITALARIAKTSAENKSLMHMGTRPHQSVKQIELSNLLKTKNSQNKKMEHSHCDYCTVTTAKQKDRQ
jgi:ribosomal protein L32